MNQPMIDDLMFDKAIIIGKLESNRKKHVKQFEKTWASFIKKQVARFEKVIKEFNNLKSDDAVPQAGILLPIPDDHTEDYDLAIEMLKLATNAEVTMSAQQYERFMLDRWDWKDRFETTNAFYAGRN